MSQPDTKQRILMIAAELFARQGYTGTTIADIARELGTTTAALYYHFPSKAAILSGLLARPLTAYMRLLGSLDSGQATPEDLLGAIIDICADSRELASILDRDPAALAMIDEQLPRSSAELTAQTVAALAGPDPDRAALIRANAALAVAKAATIAAMQLGGGKLEAADRAEVLAIAVRALKDLSRTYRADCQGRQHWPISWGPSIRARPASGSWHLARATLEAICYQTRDVVEAMAADSGVTLDMLKVDGGVTANDLCMQLQADILGVAVSRPVVAETTALGAAYAAGLAAGFWRDTTELRANWRESRRWEPTWSADRRAAGHAGWKKAVDRTLDWVDVG